ncbi:MAG: nucleoside-diphosphate kinase [Deltaproteobacteria bacterium]|jgi:nucleoside-diphosphate kinase|nr:nucleoside-diphosphate kinase [Deltaproteobacteria bacterium]
MLERTLSIIKPDAVQRNLIGAILKMIEEGGLRIVHMKRLRLSRQEAEIFYAVHRKRSFFGDLTGYLSSGPLVVSVLEGERAIQRYMALLGAANPRNADPKSIRGMYGQDVVANSVHGSDDEYGPDVAKAEIAFFFSEQELV